MQRILHVDDVALALRIPDKATQLVAAHGQDQLAQETAAASRHPGSNREGQGVLSGIVVTCRQPLRAKWPTGPEPVGQTAARNRSVQGGETAQNTLRAQRGWRMCIFHHAVFEDTPS